MGQCNLSKLDGKQVEFMSTDQVALTNTLKDTGKVMVVSTDQDNPYYRDRVEHWDDIYIAGEHIAGGYGVNSRELRDRLTYLVSSAENFNKIVQLFSETEYVDEDDSQGTVIDADASSFIANGTTYTLTNDTSTGTLYFTKEGPTALSPLMVKITNDGETIDYNEEWVVYNGGPLILEAGTRIRLKYASADVSGTQTITNYGLFRTDLPEGTNAIIPMTTYVGAQEAPMKFEANVDATTGTIDVNTAAEMRIELRVQDATFGASSKYVASQSMPIYYQLPLYYGTTQAFTIESQGKVLREDTDLYGMPEMEFTIEHGDDAYEAATHGYVAFPEQWGDSPRIVLKQSDVSGNWIRVPGITRVNINGTQVNYIVYRSRKQYRGETTWVIS